MSPRRRRPSPNEGLFPPEEPVVADVPAPDGAAAEPAPDAVDEPVEEAEAIAEATPDLEPEAADKPVAMPDTSGRSPSLRIASLHLRMGQHALARAELEAFAGRGRLDAQALLDLAEVRWRSGDLAGATEAASALLERGHEPLLALVIAAEGYATSGRPTEARRLALRAVELAGPGLETVFAGMPSGRIWPEGSLPLQPVTEMPDEAGSVGHTELAGLAAPRSVDPAPEPLTAQGDDDADPAASAPPQMAADDAIATAAIALHFGRIDQASLLFGVALRLDPSSAAHVLAQLDAPAEDPRLALVEGDALQLLGRVSEAREAYGRAGGRLLNGDDKA